MHTTPENIPKNPLRSLAIFLLLALQAICLQVAAQTDDPSFFPILCWDPQHGWNNQYTDRLNGLESMRDCNFNTGGFIRPRDIALCEHLGLKGFAYGDHDTVTLRQWNNLWDNKELSDAEIDEKIRRMVERTPESESVIGYFICDEPGASMFPRLAKAVECVKKYAPGKLAYINLFPDYATLGAPDQSQLETASYNEYLERFVTEVRPQVVSYDNYMVQYSMDLEKEEQVRSYYQNLLSIREVAQKYGLPYWNIVSSNQIRPFTTIPSPANLLFQAYTTLAAGYSSLTWYTYYARGYAQAPVDEDGEKTQTWHYLREVNRQVSVLGPIMNQLQSTGVYFTDPAPVEGLPLLPRRLVRLMETESETPLMVGEFRGEDGGDYLMVVNLSLEHSVKFRLVPKKEGEWIRMISSADGKEKPFDMEEGSWLVAGQGMLLKR